MSLIYGMWICYLLNRYLNRHIVFWAVAFLWAYLSGVHYDGLTDYLHLYLSKIGDGFGYETYYSPIRALIWIEAGFYLMPHAIKIQNRMLLSMVFLSLILLLFIHQGYFIFNTVIVLALLAIGLKSCEDKVNQRTVLLRKASIITFFAHFPIVTLIHTLYLHGVIPAEYGIAAFLITLSISYLIAYTIVKSSERFKFLKLLY